VGELAIDTKVIVVVLALDGILPKLDLLFLHSEPQLLTLLEVGPVREGICLMEHHRTVILEALL